MLLGCNGAAADGPRSEGPYFFGMASYSGSDSNRQVDDGITGGLLGFGYVLNSRWNLELNAQFANLKGVGAQDQTAIGLDLQNIFRRDRKFSPYVFVSGGVMQTEPDGASKDSGAMYGLGAGFRTDIFGNGPVSLRGEYRYRVDQALSSSLKDHVLSLGVQLSFGQTIKPVKDTDRDGVLDPDDRCPGTVAGAEVDAMGCEKDDDLDGVLNSIDECPNTPRNTFVDEVGCQLDSDEDGVVDRLDQCPDTAPGVPVDIRGCEIKAKIELPGVSFETNSAVLLPGAEQVLDDAAASLLKNSTLLVEVEGHTDNVGAADYNLDLSALRAQAVSDYLIASGVEPKRLSTRGYGESVPIADNSTATGRSQNRRVVLRILTNPES
jgi:OOP family OmpA-OmpF porin